MTIVKAFELAGNAHHLQKRDKIKAIGELQRDLVMLILELQPDPPVYETIDDVSQVFLSKVLDPQSQLTEVSTSPSQTAAMAAITYTADGNNAGRITVTNLGFKPKDFIEPKKHVDGVDEQYQIVYINDDGSAGAARVDLHGKITENVPLTHIVMNQLVNDYRQVKHPIELYDEYPENKASESDSFHQALLKGAVMFAMSRLCGQKGFSSCAFRLQKYPIPRVFVSESETTQKAHKLRVVPLSHKLGEPTASGGECTHVVVDGTKVPIIRNVCDTSISEFFVIRTVTDKKLANMEIGWFDEDVKVSTDTSFNVKVPCAVSFKDLSPNEELVLFKAPQKTSAKKGKETMVVLEPSAKKRKNE